MSYCEKPGCVEMVEILLGGGAGARAVDMRGQNGLFQCDHTVAHLLIESGADVNAKDQKGQTALFGCNAAVAKILTENGADIEARDSSGRTALLRECFSDNLELRKIKLLIERGADVNAADSHGQTSLFGCNATVAEILMDNGANTEARDSSGRTALLCESSWSDLGYARLIKIELLVNRGAQINARDRNGMNVVGNACMNLVTSTSMKPARGTHTGLVKSVRSAKLLEHLIQAGGRLPEDPDAARMVIGSLENGVEKELAKLPWWRNSDLTYFETLLQALESGSTPPPASLMVWGMKLLSTY